MPNGHIRPEDAVRDDASFRTYVVANLERHGTKIENIEGRLNELQTPGAATWCKFQDAKIEDIEGEIKEQRRMVFGTILGFIGAVGYWVFEKVAGK